MNTETFSALFLAVLLANVTVKLWLARRQLRHVAAHRAEVPAAFREQIGIAAHHKAADYTATLTRFGMLTALYDALLLLAFTLGGGIQWLHEATSTLTGNPLLQGTALIAAVLLAQSLLELPFDLYRTFSIEARFGFNKMTFRLYCLDALKSLLLGVAIGLPLLLGVLWLMAQMGEAWWLYVWGVWVLFNLLLLYLYPTFIAPLFNKFEPLKDEAQKARIEALLARCGFAASGLFVMDGSKRSAHGNAYFTGFGKTKRIVFFDTLLQRLAPQEIDAVLAHELGHFKRRHVLQRIVATFAVSLGFLWLLAQLLDAPWFYRGLGVHAQTTASALLLFFMALPVFTFLLHPLAAAWSRKHEFEADDYAARQTDAKDLISALVKLYQDNAKTLTPDPLYATFYESHPPAPVRIAHLQKLGGRHTGANDPLPLQASETMTTLDTQHCQPRTGTPLSVDEARALLKQLDGWMLEEKRISKTFAFKNYYETMAFVNAVAWMTHREDHHPDLQVGYNRCRVEYSTHSVGGLSENDFICAAKVDALFKI